MSSVQKTPFVLSMNRFIDQKLMGEHNLAGKSSPVSVVSMDATNTIATVKFELQSEFTVPQVTVPVFGPQWIRYPIRAGSFGIVFPIDFYIGGASGLGGGIAELTQQPNLTTLVFLPIGNASFEDADDPDALCMYGPKGVRLRDEGAVSQFEVTEERGAFVEGTLGKNIMGATLTEATDDPDAEAKGVIIDGFYKKADGSIWIRQV